MRFVIVLFCAILLIIFQATDDFTVWENLSICLFIFFLLDFLMNLGRKIVIMELAIILAALTCLLTPVIFYHEYTIDNPMARLWVKYMPVSSDNYFSFMVPAVVAMALGFRTPLGKLQVNKNPRLYMDNVRRILEQKPSLGLILIGVGVTSGLLDFLSPSSLKQVFYFIDHLTFVGVFYTLYSPSKYKRVIVPFVIVLMIGQTLITGMFGEFIYILACALVLILLGKQISFAKKIMVALSGIFLIIIIQSVKVDYRKKVWSGSDGADPIYYAQLIGDRIADPSTMVEPNKLFFVAVRMNQGWLVATTMARVPAKYDFAYGETIWQSVAASIVPRFLWPDKPEAGGKANLKRFWGFNLVGFSMNIGPFGEAYANFDKIGGIIFMFFYAIFFNLVLSLVLKIAEKRPTLVLWIPFLFFYAISIETDLLTTMGSLIKGVIFVWITFRVFRMGFRIDL